MQLPRLIQLIDNHKSLQRAEIPSAESYWKKTGGNVHRFFVLKLERPNQSSIWMRLDRRRDMRAGAGPLVVATSDTPANDTVLPRFPSCTTMCMFTVMYNI